MNRVSRIAVLTVAAILTSGAAFGQHYVQTNLVSDVPGVAATTDPLLVNAVGMSHTDTSPIWVSDNGTGKATLYNAAGAKQALVVTIAPPPGSNETATPTGQVANASTGFVVPKNAAAGVPKGAARFIFATEDGTISGWNPAANATNSLIGVDNSANTVGSSASAI